MSLQEAISPVERQARAHAKRTSAKLWNPPNAVEDKPIDLRPQWQKPEVVEIMEADVPPTAPPAPPPRIQFVTKFPKLESINAVVCSYYKVDRVDFISQRRTAYVCKARQVAMYLARTLTPRSLPEIGRYMHRDHTTIISGVRKIEKLLAEGDTVLAEDVRNLSFMLTPPE